MKKLIAITIAAAALAGCSSAPTQAEIEAGHYGPPPTDYKATIKAYLDRTLKDPESARIEYRADPKKSWVTHGGGLVYGHMVCANINAKNSYGGYTGFKPAYFILRYDSVIRVKLGSNPGDAAFVNRICNEVF